MLNWKTLTADGTITLGMKHKDGNVVILARGSFGGGSLTFGYEDQSGAFSPFASGTALTASGEETIALAPDIVLMAELTGSTTPSIELVAAAEWFTHEP